jgi:hypothetical protein
MGDSLCAFVLVKMGRDGGYPLYIFGLLMSAPDGDPVRAVSTRVQSMWICLRELWFRRWHERFDSVAGPMVGAAPDSTIPV